MFLGPGYPHKDSSDCLLIPIACAMQSVALGRHGNAMAARPLSRRPQTRKWRYPPCLHTRAGRAEWRPTSRKCVAGFTGELKNGRLILVRPCLSRHLVASGGFVNPVTFSPYRLFIVVMSRNRDKPPCARARARAENRRRIKRQEIACTVVVSDGGPRYVAPLRV